MIGMMVTCTKNKPLSTSLVQLTARSPGFVGENQSFTVDGRAIGQNGNVATRVVSEDPMSMVFNPSISTAWGEILLDQLRFLTIMRIDYVRIYQK
jgi:beta-glucanase (GH16 family)